MAGRLGAALSRVRDEIAGSGRVWAGGGRQANSSMLRPYEKWVATTRRQSSRAERQARQRAQGERRARISAAKASAGAAVAGLQRCLRWGVRVGALVAEGIDRLDVAAEGSMCAGGTTRH